jgi:hypothetical protein
MPRHLVALAVVLCASPASGQPCTVEKLVGTWERVSLLRNGLSVQPPDAPLFVKFGADGYWSMMEMPPDRPKIDKPLAQQSTKELWSRFERVEGGQGTWTLKADGSVVTRRHAVNIAAGAENTNQDRLCWFEGDILALVGTGANRSPQARFKRLPTQPLKPGPLVGTWERTALKVDGIVQQPPAVPLVIILGDDGWFSQTALPTGRKSVGKPLEQYIVEDYLSAFANVAASRGTYTVDGATFTRKHVADVNPNLIGWEQAAQFTLQGDAISTVSKTIDGAKIEATFRKLKPLATIAK